MKTILVILGAFFFLIVISPSTFAGGWLIYHDGPYKGKVVEAETNEPVKGAVVIAVWQLERYGGAGGPVAMFFGAKETVADKNGEFEISSITGFHWWPFSSLDAPNVIVFKPGYTSYKWYRYPSSNPEFPDGVIKLIKTKTKEERMKAIISINECGDIPDERCIPKNAFRIREKELKDLGVLK